VTAEDGTVAESVDAARDAGPNTAWHLLFAVPVVDGALDISFTPDSGVPLVGAVEVDYQNSSVTPRTLFTDDFNGPAGGPPDAAVWGADVGGNGWGNNELETYTKRPANLATDGAGSLAITARREEKTGADGITRNYTSGRLLTRDKFEFQYGTADARLRMPDGRGLLSGFWMLGSNAGTVGWPLCGEMDVVENVGSEPAIAHATVHAGGSGGTNWLAGSPATASEPLAAAFHTYGLVWGPNALGMTLDGRSYMTISASDIPKTSFWNFNHPFYLLLDLAVGGNWPGPPDAGTVFPARLWVDYVRVTG
jgi:beta-glucanase (GH16 family)